MDFKDLGSSEVSMVIQEMSILLQYDFKMVGLSISNLTRTRDEVNLILESMKSCII